MEQLFKTRKDRLQMFKSRKQSLHKDPIDIPDNLFHSCPNCKETSLFEDLMHNDYVCPHCGFPIKITAHERIRQVVDEGSFEEFNKGMHLKQVPDFPGYAEKLERLQKTTGLKEAVVTGVGKIYGQRCVLGIMDSNFFMGSMGSIVGEKVTCAIEYATEHRLPLILFTTSGGARMQEGISSLVQMAKTSAALKKHSDAGLLYISYLTHPTTGGVSASFAMLGDIILSEPNCLIGFAGKRVIASTVKEELPQNFQKAEFVLEKGFIDKIIERKDAKKVLYQILKMHERSAYAGKRK